ncbi:ankyrin repeat and MYND domain-containing protein 2 [Copidosoma floridanum]|uniref:ankyrin repeat and MYND domain-containing protein 2 n=1 Tax=Copidosoma floridanum TaxID=29053 RepID=UPI0006C9D76A|nr:ankyrin repeat and MYND domain-containing protein 2 [Copidosoma floridanum]
MSDMEVSDVQKDIFEKIELNKADELRALLAANKIKTEFTDENGMSPLQHACYKGNKDIVQMLLDHGADPNKCEHEHKYTALHFAALSGNADLCHLLMAYGAKVNALNSVGRTAAQMAAFVGNHNCVVVINNFIPKADVDYYIKAQGLQKEPMLHPHLADSFHLFIMQVNVHPIRVIMNLQKFPGLLDNLSMIQKVLETMCHKEMTKGPETNEIMAFKYHYLGCVVGEVIRFKNRQETMKTSKAEDERMVEDHTEDKSDEKKADVVELLVKKLLKCKSNGSYDYQEQFLKDIVREFNYRDSAIFRQMVATLASSSPPSAVSVIAAAINGQRAFNDSAQICATCGEEKATKKCSRCKTVQYCDRECQRVHWFLHKRACNRLSQSNSSQEKIPDEIDSRQISTDVTSRLEQMHVS